MIALSYCLFSAAGCASTATARSTNVASTDVTREVEAVYRAGITAFNEHALDRFVSQFADDIRMYTPTGWVNGKSAVVERFRATFAQFPKARMEIDSLEVAATGTASATVAFRWRVFPMGQGPAFHGVGSGVYLRRNDRWVEVLEHETVTRVDEALQQPAPPSSRR
jgi:uncharacterized protein (TIGR02246 family)